MALTGGLQYIDNLALRFSLHGLEDKFTPKPTFCFSWSEPFDLDSVSGKLRSNPKRSRSFPITKKKPEKQNTNRIETKHETAKSLLNVQTKDHDAAVRNNNNVTIITTKSYSETRSTSTCINLEEESSDEELCDIMLQQENIKINQDFSAFNKRSEQHGALGFENLCEKKKQPSLSRKRYLEELDMSTSGQAKRSRPRLDFDKVLLSRTNYSDEENSATKRSSYFAPISGSDSDDNV